MKNLFVCLCIFLVSHSYAQIEQGSFLMGSSFSYSQGKSKETNVPPFNRGQSQFNVAFRLGYFIGDRIAIGIIGGPTYLHTTYDYPSLGQHQDVKTNLYSIGAFGRFYKYYKNGFGFFGELDAVYIGGNTVSTYVTTNTTAPASGTNYNVKAISAALRPGVIYFINSRVAIEGMFGSLMFQTNTSGYDPILKNTGLFDLSLAMSNLYLGFNFYFGN